MGARLGSSLSPVLSGRAALPKVLIVINARVMPAKKYLPVWLYYEYVLFQKYCCKSLGFIRFGKFRPV
jgi:hypothetical protein